MARGNSRAQSEVKETGEQYLARIKGELQQKHKAAFEAQREARKPIREKELQISREAYAALPAGTEFPFGTIGDDLTPENFYDKFEEYMTDDSTNVPRELKELNPDLENRFEASQKASELEGDDEGDAIPARYYAQKDKSGNEVYRKMGDNGVQGTSRDDTVVVSFPSKDGKEPIKIEMTYSFTTTYVPYQNDDYYQGFDYDVSSSAQLKGIRVL